MNTKLTTTFYWVESNTIKKEHLTIKINQVYVWIITADHKVILVSKDGQKWQFPGGHPEVNETITETAIREIKEETGQNIQTIANQLQFFGYYLVSEPNSEGTSLVEILQTRFFIRLNKNSCDLILTPQEKDTEKESEKINSVKAFTITEACEVIPWLKKSEELNSFLLINKTPA